MKYLFRIAFLLPLLLAWACVRESFDPQERVEDGMPVTLTIGFGSSTTTEVQVMTKTEATRVEETTIHDLYVFLFDGTSGEKLYGRYFSYDNRVGSTTALDNSHSECWYVENKTQANVVPAVATTRGAVKLSTVSNPNCTLVVLANVSSALISMTRGNDYGDALACLNGVHSYSELYEVKVGLKKNTVDRKDFFMMMSEPRSIDSGAMEWNKNSTPYNENYRVILYPLDAKVKFRIKANSQKISGVTPRYWEVCNVPSGCYLFEDANGGHDQTDRLPFDTATAYFGEPEVEGDDTYYVFCFYMLENRLPHKDTTPPASSYYDREKQVKESDAQHPGYVKNKDEWVYANDKSTYVRFDLILSLKDPAITEISESLEGAGTPNVAHALTTDAIFTVHLGDFTNSDSTVAERINDYNTFRNHSYTYNVTINNSVSIYTEVMDENRDREDQPGQEGFLLLTNDEIINCDAHYEYHSMTFTANSELDPNKYSWFIKSPFGDGRPVITFENDTYYYPPEGDLDYKWVKFALNPVENGEYTTLRQSYPGEKNGQYNPDWKVGDPGPRPELLDVAQLVSFIVDQNRRKFDLRADHQTDNLFVNNQIRVTAFVDEFYYEEHPITGETDPQLWREFVNVLPRELHILSNAVSSKDRASDVITSSHSIIQESIQTIYNQYEPTLRSLWGTEHKDEMKKKIEESGGTAWAWGTPAGSGNDMNNGRLNTAKLWGVYSGTPSWNTYLKYDVDNDTPELREDYYAMAYSCLTRNRDNDGDDIIDPDEVRWYLASINQLIATWVGNEALSSTARPYQPVYDANDPMWWHAHVVSSSCKSADNPYVLSAEEGISFYEYKSQWVPGWDMAEANKHQSVRCLRNIGTYDSGSGVVDISEAPFAQAIDQYYQRTDNADGTYTLNFSRLSPMALRDFTDSDFTLSFETSPNNRVYLEIIAQDPTNTKIPDGNPDKLPYGKWEDQGVILTNIDQKGHNDYCPDGYRLPNQRELAIMVISLPSSYWANINYLPSCTLYSRGKYGSDIDKFNNQSKLGWVKSTSKIHLQNVGQVSKYFRCVKDHDLTGSIQGKLSAKDGCAGDYITLDFKFASTESALTEAFLTLNWTNSAGQPQTRDIPVEKKPTSLQYNETQEYLIPSLSSLGIDQADLPCTMQLDLVLRNAAGNEGTFQAEFLLEKTHLKDVTIDFPQIYSETDGLPVQIDVTSRSRAKYLSSVVLRYKEYGASAWQEKNLGISHASALYQVSRALYLKEIFGDDFLNDVLGKRILYQVHAESEDGTFLDSPIRSMELLRFSYNPNPVPSGGWTNISQCQTKWDNTVTGLDFSRGDYIEADMDLTNCQYVYVDGNQDHDLGKDNLMGFSTDNVATITNSMIWYYPSVQNLVAPPGDIGKIWMRIHAGRWSAHEVYGAITQLNLILDKDGILRDGNRYTGNPGDWNSRVKAALTSSSTINLGSKEGIHQSRAIYNYVRVIRNEE